MKKLLLAGATVLSLGVMAMAPAEARDGCGVHRYRTPNGVCHWYGGYARGPVVRFGVFAGPGYGWHHGHRWHRWHNGRHW